PGAGGGVRVVVDVHPCDGLSSIDRDRARLEAARVVIIDAHLDGPGGHGAQGVHVVVIAATSTATTSSTTVVVMIVIVVVVVIVTNDRRGCGERDEPEPDAGHQAPSGEQIVR